MVAWGGVIGVTLKPFKLKNSTLNVTGYFQRISGYGGNRAVVAVVPRKYNTTQMNLVLGADKVAYVSDVQGSAIEGCKLSCLMWTSKDYSTTSATSIDPATLTFDLFHNKENGVRDNLVCGQGFTANEGVTISNNTYL